MEKTEVKAAHVAPKQKTLLRELREKAAAANQEFLAAVLASREPDDPTYEPLRNRQVRYGLALGFPITQTVAMKLSNLELTNAWRDT